MGDLSGRERGLFRRPAASGQRQRTAERGPRPLQEVGRHALLEQPHEFRIEKAIFVRNLEADHAARAGCAGNIRERARRCSGSIVKITSAQSSIRLFTRTSASSLVPAERTSRSGRLQNRRSAVALRQRLNWQMKRTLRIVLWMPHRQIG